MNLKPFLFIILCSPVFFFPEASADSNSTTTTAQEETSYVNIKTPSLDSLKRTSLTEPRINAKAVLFPFKRAVISTIIDTTVKTYLCKAGDSFSRGDVLVKLDDTLYREKFNKAKAYAAFANEVYRNNLALMKQGGIGHYELAKSKFESAAANAEFEIAKAKLESCVIKAPFAGRVIKKIANEYEYVQQGAPVVEIVDDNTLLAVTYISSSLLKTIKINDEMNIKIDETGTICKGKIYTISGDIDPRSRTFEIKILIDNKNKKLTVGMSGNIILKNHD